MAEDHLEGEEAATTTALRGHEVEDGLNSLRIRRKAYRDPIIELRSFESFEPSDASTVLFRSARARGDKVHLDAQSIIFCIRLSL